MEKGSTMAIEQAVMSREEVKAAIVASFGGEILPGGFSAQVVANFYYKQMVAKNHFEVPNRETITALINRSQGW
jgi:hypothetical protein